VFEWSARFWAGRTSVEDGEQRSSSTKPGTVGNLQEFVREDRCGSIEDRAEEIGIGYGTCQRILNAELGMHRVSAKFVPRILTAE
jgi:hypothetical protein